MGSDDALGGPATGLLDGLLEDPGGERVDQAALLGQRDELGRRDDPADRVDPADQGLDVLDLVGAHVDQRLVVQGQLAQRRSVAQLGEDGQPVPVGLVGRGVVDGPAAAGPLGAVHRDVGALQQHARLVAVLAGERDADARGQRHGHLGQVERLLEAGQQLARDGARLDRRVQVGQADRELVAAQPRDRVGPAQRGAQPLGDLAQQQVAGVVAERVVDVLEAVEVEQQQADVGPVAVGGGQRLLEPVGQQGAVGQPGQAVVQRLVAHLLLGPPALDDRGRDVGDGQQEVDVGLAERPAYRGEGREHAVRAGVALDRHADARRARPARAARWRRGTGCRRRGRRP